jgi:hypothetical protein
LLQIEVLAGGRHELPHARRARHRHRLRVERAFDEGQQRQLGGHAALVDLFDDVEQIAAAALGHALHVVGPRCVPLLPLHHQRVVQVGHGEAGAHPQPQVAARVGIVVVDDHRGTQRVECEQVRRGLA